MTIDELYKSETIHTVWFWTPEAINKRDPLPIHTYNGSALRKYIEIKGVCIASFGIRNGFICGKLLDEIPVTEEHLMDGRNYTFHS
jgi:hypothetical protein